MCIELNDIIQWKGNSHIGAIRCAYIPLAILCGSEYVVMNITSLTSNWNNIIYSARDCFDMCSIRERTLLIRQMEIGILLSYRKWHNPFEIYLHRLPRSGKIILQIWFDLRPDSTRHSIFWLQNLWVLHGSPVYQIKHVLALIWVDYFKIAVRNVEHVISYVDAWWHPKEIREIPVTSK